MSNARKFLKVVVLGLASFAFAPSYAQTTSGSSWMGGRMDTSLYLGGNVGQSMFSSSCNNVPVGCDDKDTGWRLFAGYQFHRNFAVEAGYFDMGKASASGLIGAVPVSAEAKVSGLEILGVAMFPFSSQWAVFGKLGIARSRVRVSASAPLGGFTASASDNSTDVTYGLGAQYSFARNVAARAEWQRYDGVGGSNTGKDDIDLFSLGLLYRF